MPEQTATTRTAEQAGSAVQAANGHLHADLSARIPVQRTAVQPRTGQADTPMADTQTAANTTQPVQTPPAPTVQAGNATPPSTGQTGQSTAAGQRAGSGEPRLGMFASWAVLAASFALSASTWINLARVAGFNEKFQLADGFKASLAWFMPVAVDGYVVVALVLWMSPVPAAVAEFAKKNTYAAAGFGIAAQAAYHSLTAWSTPNVQVWQVIMAAIVGCLPPAVAGLAVHMRALIRREAGGQASTCAAGSVQAPAAVQSVQVSAVQPPPCTATSGVQAALTSTVQAAADSVQPRQPVQSTPPRVQAAPIATAPTEQKSAPTVQAPAPTPKPAAKPTPAAVQTANIRPATPTNPAMQTGAVPTIEELADALALEFGNKVIGRPKALAHLKTVYGRCSGERADEAKNLYNSRCVTSPTLDPDSVTDPDRELVSASA